MTLERFRSGSPVSEAPRLVQEAPALSRMTDWLCSPDVVAADGAVSSWANPAHPGYAYPEAAALWLSHFAFAGGLQPVSETHPGRAALCASVAGWLGAQVRADGALGRGAHGYLFDSAVGLAALVRYASVTGWTPAVEAPARRLFDYLERGVRKRVPVTPPPPAADRWSLRFEPHLLKLALSLSLYGDATGTRVAGLIDALVAEVDLREPVRWASAPDTYSHALCYAAEGLLVLRSLGAGVKDEELAAVLDVLGRLQRADGGLPAFVGGGEPRTDATAQALRAWTLFDADRYASHRQRALGFLASVQAPAGGLAYAPGLGDVNTWATLFAVQALGWQRPGAARADRLL